MDYEALEDLALKVGVEVGDLVLLILLGEPLPTPRTKPIWFKDGF